jgi:hypothetical protein
MASFKTSRNRNEFSKCLFSFRVEFYVQILGPKTKPGSTPTKHDFPYFTHICNIFLQTCVNVLTHLLKMNLTKFLQIFVSLI